MLYSNQRLEQNDLENRIIGFEGYAFQKFQNAMKAIRAIRAPALSSGVVQFLKNKIIPLLKQIGFDESLAWSLFYLTSEWGIMSPLNENVRFFHPVLMKDIEEVKKGFISKSLKNDDNYLFIHGKNPEKLYEAIKESMHPKHLLSLLDDISISWIILPRVYDHLDMSQSRCLAVYLDHIAHEKEIEFRKILIRITIEFLGNFTFKYHDKLYPEVHIREALFFGFVAMFCKNLRSPPDEYEHSEIFENFRRWAIKFQKRFAPENSEMAAAVENMISIKENIFPQTNAFGLIKNDPVNMENFYIALRHGRNGVETAVKFFGTGGTLIRDKTDGRLPYTEVPLVLSSFFRKIKNNFLYRNKENKTIYSNIFIKAQGQL